MAIWVDDGLLCSNHQSKLEDIVNYLSDNFEITSGPVDHFVGLEISRDRRKGLIHIFQQAYVKKILARFRMGDCKPRSIPADPCSHLEKQFSTSETQDYPYREAIGPLMFAAICTRLDISYAVCQVAKYSSKPSHVHWEGVKRIFAYLKGTISLGISYLRGVKDGVLLAFSDSDFAGDADDRRSTTGNIFILNGSPV
ncbi:secreted RxLR effector protein 161-like [Daphnia magna]|uniref:secreted RxLR effector protein 161-like n=1 Tax=Daphnia magna TaxID=35525 RepID=UPI001E1BD205|nr:secreted RxLR effector protein 161-like [Daphnia magna]